MQEVTVYSLKLLPRGKGDHIHIGTTAYIYIYTHFITCMENIFQSHLKMVILVLTYKIGLEQVGEEEYDGFMKRSHFSRSSTGLLLLLSVAGHKLLHLRLTTLAARLQMEDHDQKKG